MEPYRSYLDYHKPGNFEQCLDMCNFYDEKRDQWDFADYVRTQQMGKQHDVHFSGCLLTPDQTEPRLYSNNNFPMEYNFFFNFIYLFATNLRVTSKIVQVVKLALYITLEITTHL